ncbi:MAG: tyrosine--tRNA ligase, partial [Chryseobacterium culicis]
MIHSLQENVAIILPENGLEEKLAQAKKENRKLSIKLGFDPTAPDLHLGHAVVLKKLKQFQDLGHQIIIVVGSFTARIGDPTGKNKARKPLSTEDVQHNAETYINQLSKVIDVQKTKIVFNSDWLDTLDFSEVIQLLSKVTVAQLMHRNDFNKRFTENTPIAMHELVYPILQGFDSVKIECDIEMGGTDQLFNCTMGRQLQEVHQMPAQIVMCMPLLRGLDGKEKMSKSLNNIIGLTDEPNEMFGKTMSIPDALIEEFINLATDFSMEEKRALFSGIAKGENPMDIKKQIAKNIITQYHDAVSAENAEQFFINQFQNKNFEEKKYEPV